MASQPGEQITYQKRESDWGAISGFKGSKIFYRKAVLACGGTVWHAIAFEYPAARKREMDFSSFVHPTASIRRKTTAVRGPENAIRPWDRGRLQQKFGKLSVCSSVCASHAEG